MRTKTIFLWSPCAKVARLPMWNCCRKLVPILQGSRKHACTAQEQSKHAGRLACPAPDGQPARQGHRQGFSGSRLKEAFLWTPRRSRPLRRTSLSWRLGLGWVAETQPLCPVHAAFRHLKPKAKILSTPPAIADEGQGHPAVPGPAIRLSGAGGGSYKKASGSSECSDILNSRAVKRCEAKRGDHSSRCH